MPDTSFTEFTLGKYRAVALLGRGGFGTVFRALDTTLDREVALKVLHPQLAADPNFVTRFRQEAKIIAALRHPNVVGVYELGEAEGRLFIAMEYMPGGTLKDRIMQQGHLSFAETLRIMQQVCAGLDAAHGKGMIHRDIKPANILFGPDGQAVVSDFGLARAVQLSSMASSSSSVGGVGTSFYKAPELWRGKPPASPATDVYALACMVYEMLTGHVLFSGDTPDEVLTKHLIDGPDFGEDWLPADAPQGLVAVIRRGIARNPEERYATAQGFFEALNEQVARSRMQEAAQRIAEAAALEAKRQQEAEAAMLAAQRQHEAEDKAKREVAAPSAVSSVSSKPPTKTPWGLIIGGVAAIGALIVIVLLASGNRPAVVPLTPITQTSDKDGMTLVYVPAGLFMMGNNKGEADEKPEHIVYLDAFWIDQTEVTNAMYAKCVTAGLCQAPSDKSSPSRGSYYGNSQFDNYPVIHVLGTDAKAYCTWAGGDLPTEAQWEKAARGDDQRTYPWGNDTPDKTRLNYNFAVGDTTQVGAYPTGVSPYGALDMAGNVWEWVADWHDENYYSSAPARNPAGPSSGTLRVLRGGGWADDAAYVRASVRLFFGPVDRDSTGLFGFRCAR